MKSKREMLTAGMAMVAIAGFNIMGVEGAIGQSSPPTLIAQSLAGQCRAAKRDIFIYREANTNSRVRALQLNEAVTLADNGNNGWIAISAPTTGFVQTADLKPCPSASNPKPDPAPPAPKPTNLCRQVTIVQGLVVRDQPSIEGKIVGSVAHRQQVTLKSDAVTVVDKRSWVEITAPVKGWVSSGVGGGANLGECGPTSQSAQPAQTSPTPPATYCSRVTWQGEEGLGIRKEAGGNAVATLRYGDEITLRSREEKVIFDPQLPGNRFWIEITQPMAGWISSGIQGGGRNIAPPTPCR